MMIEPSHISVRSWGQWSLGEDNINYIDHLRKGQSLVCIRELEVVVDAASIGGLLSAWSSKAPLNFGLHGCTGYPICSGCIGDPRYRVCS